MAAPEDLISSAIAGATQEKLPRPRRIRPTSFLDWLNKEPAEHAFDLTAEERLWASIEPALRTAGYSLRPRYRPGWIGSWVGTGKPVERCEDSISLGRAPTVLDAVRVSDGAQVVLKLWSNNQRDGPERSILAYFSRPEHAGNGSNHCVPLLACLPFPSDVEGDFEAILVEPLLRTCQYPPCLMVAEVLSFMLQLIEGLEYLHLQNVAHGDIHNGNIMMSPEGMFPNGFHGAFNWSIIAQQYDEDHKQNAKRTRLQIYVKYYYIDFGSSV